MALSGFAFRLPSARNFSAFRYLTFFFLPFALFLAVFLLSSSPVYATTFVSGAIPQNTIWTAAGSPYVITGSGATVNTGVTLTVESGAVVKFQSSTTTLTVYGALNATGAVFTSYKDDSYGGDTNGDGSATSPSPNDWNQINFNNGTGSLAGRPPRHPDQKPRRQL